MNAAFEALRGHPEWLLGLFFVVAFFEALAVVGVVVPGVLIFFGLAMALGLEPGLFLAAWAVSSLGAFLGDGVSFWLGRRWQPELDSEVVRRARTLFHAHGGKSLFIGRFIGPIRPVVPLVGGMLGVRPSTFLLFATPACVLWAPTYLLPGMIFGASLEMAAAMAGRLAVVLVVLVMGLWFSLWLVRVVYAFTAKRSSWWLKRLVQWSHRHPKMGRWLEDVFQPGSREVIAIAFLGLIFGLSLAALIGLLLVAPQWLPQWSGPFHPATWASSLRNDWADGPMAAVSLLGETSVLVGLVLIMTGALVAVKRWQAVGHWWVAVLGVSALAWLIQRLMDWAINRPPPEAVAYASLLDIPHSGFALLVTTLGFFALVVAKDLAARHRKWPYLLTATACVLIGFSWFYLELASLMGLASALALAMGWVSLVGMGYRHRSRVNELPKGLMAMFVVVWVALGWVNVHKGIGERLASSQVPLAEAVMPMDAWLAGGWQTLPQTRSVLGPRVMQSFDFQWAGPLVVVADRLSAAGWQAMPQLSWRERLDRVDSQPMPWPRAFNGQREVLWMQKTNDQGGVEYLIRLWRSGVSIDPQTPQAERLPVWLVQLRGVEPAPNWLGLTRWTDRLVPDRVNALAEREAPRVVVTSPRLLSEPID